MSTASAVVRGESGVGRQGVAAALEDAVNEGTLVHMLLPLGVKMPILLRGLEEISRIKLAVRVKGQVQLPAPATCERHTSTTVHMVHAEVAGAFAWGARTAADIRAWTVPGWGRPLASQSPSPTPL